MKQGLSEQELLEQLAALPREITPAGDVWPDIAKGICRQETAHPERTRKRWWLQAIAASVAVVFIAGFLLGRQWETAPGTGQAVVELAGSLQTGPVQTVYAGVLAGTLTASELEYQAAFREFIPVGVSQQSLPQPLFENLTTGWAELSAAEDALLKALQDNPGNSFLSAKMLELRSRQLEFLQRITSMDRNSRRTSI